MESTHNLTPKNCRKEHGFTLVELMIVLVVIAIVASIATMSGLAARVRANEGTALGSLKAISGASEIYRNTIGSYPENLSKLSPEYIAQDVGSGQKGGYVLELKSANQGATFTCTAVPMSQHYTGVKSYCINALNAIQVYQDAPALSADGVNCPSGGTSLS